MGRLPRPTGDDLIYHAINRGNNRADVLGPDGERDMFLGDLARTKARYPFALLRLLLDVQPFSSASQAGSRAFDQPHPPVPDRRTLAAPPETGNQRPRLAGPLPIPGHPGRRPPARRSEVHRGQPGAGRDGGRPVRVYLVEPPLPWRRACRSHPRLVPGMGALGRTEPERRARWRRKVRGEQPAKELDGVRSSARSGRPYGAEDWVEVISHRLGIVREPRRRGRPPREKMLRHRNSVTPEFRLTLQFRCIRLEARDTSHEACCDSSTRTAPESGAEDFASSVLFKIRS